MAYLHGEDGSTTNGTYNLSCNECNTLIAQRCMESCLISDASIVLYSTNDITIKVAQIYECYTARKCNCAVKDIACLYCGNVVGYQIVQPCLKCLQANNNGHLTMFHSTKVDPEFVRPVTLPGRYTKGAVFHFEIDR